MKLQNWIYNNISMANVVVPRRWWSQRIHKDDNKDTTKKKTEIFIERIFTVIWPIENREEKFEWETICFLNYFHCREQQTNLLKSLFPSMILSLPAKSKPWIYVTVQFFHPWRTEQFISYETSTAQAVKQGRPSILTEEPTGGRIFGSEFS